VDDQFDSKVADVCGLYRQAPALAERGERVISTDEMTGVQALERKTRFFLGPPDFTVLRCPLVKKQPWWYG